MGNEKCKMKFVLFLSRKGEKKSPIGPTTPKPMGSREKGGNIMGAICSVSCLCKQSANIADTCQTRFQKYSKNGENSRTRCGVLVFAGILSKEQDSAVVYLRVALCFE